jgi:hypothetical protein
MSGLDEAAWYRPPEAPDPVAREIQALSGDSAAFTRAVSLGQIPPERVAAARAILSPGALALLDHAPAPDTWVPVAVVREFFTWAAENVDGGLPGTIARQHARRDAGRENLMGEGPPSRVLPGTQTLDLLAGLESVWGRYFQGGTIRADRVEVGQAWISVWSTDLFPGWAAVDLTNYLTKVLAEGYGVKAQVTYLPPPPDRPWWHRYHLHWEA